MANQEHLDLLKQGVEIWNQWRNEHARMGPDLSKANLAGVNLSHANLAETDFTSANLTGANLVYATLSKAKLWNAKLSRTDLRGAKLRGTDLSGADLYDADLSYTYLRGTVLREANLRQANLNRAFNLGEADLSRAVIGWTIFGDVDLSGTKGLETVTHKGPSTIGIDAIYRSHGKIPEAFLKGAGVDDTFITYIRSLVGKPIEYYSCFIIYSRQDDGFAKRLHPDFQNHNVRCWFAPEDLKCGERIRTGIDEAIHLHAKLLLILSKHSVASGWVEREVKTALAKERKEKRVVLFPVRLDGAVFDSPFEWATEIRHERNIGDFTRWKNHDDYQKTFSRLLRDLKAGAEKTGSRDVRTKDS